ncbi:AAA family ATPase [Rhizobium sp. Leaf371]|uniref:ATP-binding protein n=1 Tax=Rhizobium sp. Leaf371 TaxID=1736355 RepID=UPI000714AA75|nr:ATP-binding protein [Rhizobium sp. Leaf371]KQS67920.1 AAA family ATPase [Rhizobium sp. Leaf371]
MDEVRNPFAPGAGTQPPELAGRDGIIKDVRIALQRAVLGRNSRSQMLLGLRGVGKTVLLNRIQEMAEDEGHLTSFIEAPEGNRIVDLLYPKLVQVLRKLSLTEKAKASAHSGLRALRGFAGAFKVEIGDISISVDPESGTADSGNLEYDLSDLFLKIGAAAKAANCGWTLLIDEVQYLAADDLSALIVALHRANQKALPVLFFGAGLPQAAALSGDAKSYAERIFSYPSVGPLNDMDARAAIRNPIEQENESISDAAIRNIVAKTQGYPYFLQEWGYQVWNMAAVSPISEGDVDRASIDAIQRLDEGFFRVRFDRLTTKERRYVICMARLGNGPYRSGDVAAEMQEKVTSLGPTRSSIIRKGMIYSPSHGDIDFTVPLFAEYLKRNWEVTSA